MKSLCQRNISSIHTINRYISLPVATINSFARKEMFAYVELLHSYKGVGWASFSRGAQFNTYVYGTVLLCYFSV